MLTAFFIDRSHQFCLLNILPKKTKILDMTKLKTFTDNKLSTFPDDKLSVSKMTISFLDREENTVGKGKNAGYQHFLLFP